MHAPALFSGFAHTAAAPSADTGERLAGTWHKKPWGMRSSSLFAGFSHDDAMGELRFTPPAALPSLLVKYLCAAQDLSVQIHPTAAQARRMELGASGKDECWIILHAETGARIGLGLRQSIGRDEFAAAIKDGSIIDLLETIPVKAGDFFYIPANTIHTVGAGIILLEIQQNCDITFRLHDFGRARALHLAECIACARLVRHALCYRRKAALAKSSELIAGPYFSVYAICNADTGPVHHHPGGPLLVLPLTGGAAIGATRLSSGECGLARDWRHIGFSPGSTSILVFPSPQQP